MTLGGSGLHSGAQCGHVSRRPATERRCSRGPSCRYHRAHDDPTHGARGHRGRRPRGRDGVLRRARASGGATLHQLRHGTLTHDAEDGAGDADADGTLRPHLCPVAGQVRAGAGRGPGRAPGRARPGAAPVSCAAEAARASARATISSSGSPRCVLEGDHPSSGPSRHGGAARGNLREHGPRVACRATASRAGRRPRIFPRELSIRRLLVRRQCARPPAAAAMT